MRRIYITLMSSLLLTLLLLPKLSNSIEYFNIYKEYGYNKNISTTKKNTLFVEAFGNGLLYSIGYDRLFFPEKTTKLSLSIGVTPFIGQKQSTMKIDAWLSPQVNCLIGKDHNLEIGIGYTFLGFYIDYINRPHLIFYRIGYRYQKTDGGLFFRIGFTPYSFIDKAPGINLDNPFMPWGGIAIGWTF
jgi:hypothetical protein